MSADNYVVVKMFGDNDYRWAMFFASDDEENHDKAYWHKGFKTPREAMVNAEEECTIIDYGIRFNEGCLHLDN